MVCKLQILIDKELEDLSFIYFTSPIDRASKKLLAHQKSYFIYFFNLIIFYKQWKKINFQIRFVLYVKDHLTGEKSGQKFGMKWNIVLMLVKKKIIWVRQKVTVFMVEKIMTNG